MTTFPDGGFLGEVDEFLFTLPRRDRRPFTVAADPFGARGGPTRRPTTGPVMDRMTDTERQGLIAPATFLGAPVATAASRADRRTAQNAKTIELRTPSVTRAYAARIARHLERSGHRVRIAPCPEVRIPATIDWLLYFERLAYRSHCASFEQRPLAATAAQACDLVIDLAGTAPESETPTLRLVFETGVGEAGLLAALLASRSPAFDIVATRAGEASRTLRSTRLGVEHPLKFGGALDAVTARLVTLLGQAVEDLDHDTAVPRRAPDLSEPPPVSAVGFVLGTLAERIGQRLGSLLRQPGCWRLAVRVNDGRGVMDRLDWSGPDWRVVPDDGQRYLRGPVPVRATRAGAGCSARNIPYATGKGILSVAPVGDDGAVGAPVRFSKRPATCPGRRSSPTRGEIYMMPESAAAGPCRTVARRRTSPPLGTRPRADRSCAPMIRCCI